MISTKHKLYNKYYKIWQKVRDASEGEDQIKSKKGEYLPKPSQMEEETYNNYLHRAKYVNYTGKVLTASIAQLFRIKPVINEVNDILNEDIDLEGSTISAFSRQIANELLLTNRVGVLVDWSDNQSRSYLTLFQAEQIINWRESEGKPILIVLEGNKEIADPENEYNSIGIRIWKELYIEDDIYKVRDWEEVYNNKTKEFKPQIINEYIPMINDNYFNYIPFFCITTLGDNLSFVKSPLLDLANLNLGSYVNSADYENMLHWSSARTIITNGLGDTDFHIGGVVDFNIGGGAQFLETKSDSLLLEELKHKEEQMAVLGSNILSGKGRYVASAETSRINAEGEYASLSDIATSLSEVMTNIIRVAETWLNNKESKAQIFYNTVFEQNKMPSDELRTLVDAVIKGVISRKVFYSILEAREIYPEEWSFELETQELLNARKEQLELYNNEFSVGNENELE